MQARKDFATARPKVRLSPDCSRHVQAGTSMNRREFWDALLFLFIGFCLGFAAAAMACLERR
jgi:hypothetical protein